MAPKEPLFPLVEQLTDTENVLNSWAIHDPSVTLNQARQAAIRQQQAFEQIHSVTGTTSLSLATEFARQRLLQLGIDPDTLKVLPADTTNRKP